MHLFIAITSLINIALGYWLAITFGEHEQTAPARRASGGTNSPPVDESADTIAVEAAGGIATSAIDAPPAAPEDMLAAMLPKSIDDDPAEDVAAPIDAVATEPADPPAAEVSAAQPAEETAPAEPAASDTTQSEVPPAEPEQVAVEEAAEQSPPDSPPAPPDRAPAAVDTPAAPTVVPAEPTAVEPQPTPEHPPAPARRSKVFGGLEAELPEAERSIAKVGDNLQNERDTDARGDNSSEPRAVADAVDGVAETQAKVAPAEAEQADKSADPPKANQTKEEVASAVEQFRDQLSAQASSSALFTVMEKVNEVEPEQIESADGTQAGAVETSDAPAVEQPVEAEQQSQTLAATEDMLAGIEAFRAQLAGLHSPSQVSGK